MKCTLMARILFPLLPCFEAVPAELPVRQVTLFKHGVGYFERSGSIAPGDSARLDFKAAEMNDVLKSLSVTEKGGGRVAGLRYDSSIPLQEKLAEFPFHIADDQPLSAILDQLRGTRVELQFGTEKVAGVIAGARVVPAMPPPAGGTGTGMQGKEQITLLLDSGDLRTYDLAAASGIRFSDPKLQTQFREYLAAVASSRSVEKRSLFIDSDRAAAPREITASYIVPSPVWKSSYRLMLSAAAPVLEGWAIVDNTTGEDWSGVRMALVSGKPISFISQLYEPKYVSRRNAELPEDQAVAPTIHAGAMNDGMLSKSGGVLGGIAGGIAGGVAGGIVGGIPSAAPPPPPERLEQFSRLQRPASMTAAQPSTISAQAGARELGDLFEYAIAMPVTVRKNESVMLPFLQDKIDARRLLIYSDPAAVHPLQAAELTNSTGKTLDGGPVTVYDAGAYAGEALVETVKAGDKRLVSYAVDLGTRITNAFDSQSAIVREIHIKHGVITSKLAAAETKTYSVKNVDRKSKTLLIEHAQRPGYVLISPKPAETTPAAYRFEIPLPADGTARLAVAEERVYSTAVSVSSAGSNLLGSYAENTHLSDAARRSLGQVIAAKARIDSLDRQIATVQQRIDSVGADGKRLRDNIAALNGVAGQQGQVQSYATKLAAQEAELSGLNDRRSALQSERAVSQTALDTLIERLDF
ncbi:MAG: DUF4139 domain-containing protein [Acidobacteriota bacterium]|nr:DUF4139 domain-containing protein [Acidobacteriota bacterium]